MIVDVLIVGSMYVAFTHVSVLHNIRPTYLMVIQTSLLYKLLFRILYFFSNHALVGSVF